MKISDFVILLRVEMRDKLKSKSAWGKQQVLMLFEVAVANALLMLESGNDQDS